MAVKLADLIPQPKVVSIPGTDHTLSVRGLTFEELVKLIAEHEKEIVQFLDPGEVRLESLVVAAPEMVAKVICLASDTVGQEMDARKLPFATQADALMAIWELSVPDLKKLAESLSGLVAATRKINAEKARTSVQ